MILPKKSLGVLRRAQSPPWVYRRDERKGGGNHWKFFRSCWAWSKHS